MALLQDLDKAFAAAGGKKLSEGGTSAGNVAILNALGLGGFQQISGGGLISAVKDILPGGNGGKTTMFENLMPVDTGPEFDFSGALSAGLGIVQNLTAPSQQPSTTWDEQLLNAISPLMRQLGAGQIDTGITRKIQGSCAPARRRFKIVTQADGTPTVISVCPPRRMNPLNARALGRAARRLGSFQRIATHIEKTIARACKTKSRRRSPMPRKGCC